MSHRVRSKTVDSTTDSKRSKGAAPRRITERIAIIKMREHEQAAEFEQAMQSIFEMQQARIHSGGGSMPSLQAIDSTPPAPTIDMQSIFRDFDEMKRGSGTSRMEAPLPRGPPIARHSSMETEPYIPMNKSDHYWNTSGEWLEGDLARHKSDSDLQQSLLMTNQGSPLGPHQPLQHVHRQHKIAAASPTDLSLWNNNKKRPNSATTHALLSPDHYMPPPERLTPPPMGGASVGTASSLPDLTNIEFSSGLDVPLERDESPLPLSPGHQYSLPPQGLPFIASPTNRTVTGTSKLVYNSFQAPQLSPSRSAFPVPYSSPPVTGGYHTPSLSSAGGGISRSPTMPEFRNIHSNDGFVARYRPPHYKPLLPDGLSATFPGFLPQVGVVQSPAHYAPPPMTIIIQPPVPTSPLLRQHLDLREQPPLNSPTNYDIPLSPEKSQANQYLNGVSSSHKAPSPSYTSQTSFGGICLPSYTESRLQQSLQNKFASINVSRNESMVRSHSEENLQQKVAKERAEVIQQNPFMGTLANANSVPCVYVESAGVEGAEEQRGESPPLDSPSTSASYASSPPSVRPYWIEEDSTLRDYVFKEWPLDGGVGSGQPRPGSPLAHHRSLTDLGSIIPDITELVSSNRSHQLSLPSVAMTDLTVDEQLERGQSDYYHDYDMGEALMDSLLKNDVPDLHPFDMFPSSDHSSLGVSPGTFLRTDFN